MSCGEASHGENRSNQTWNSEIDKQKYKKRRTIKNGKREIEAARRKGEMHELESDRYKRLSAVDWRQNENREITQSSASVGGFYITYDPAERDAREQAFLLWREKGIETMMHRHRPGEPCVEVVYGGETGIGGGLERLKVGCEWIGKKK